MSLPPKRSPAAEGCRSERLATLAHSSRSEDQEIRVCWVAGADPHLNIWLYFKGTDGWWYSARGRGFRLAARDLPTLRAALDRALALAGADGEEPRDAQRS